MQTNVFYQNLLKFCAKKNNIEVTTVTDAHLLDIITAALPNRTEYDCQQALHDIKNSSITDIAVARALAEYFYIGIHELDPALSESMLGTKTYIAGPITAVPDAPARFAAAQAYLEGRGCHAFNPLRATTQLPEFCMTRKDFMNHGLSILGMCTQIAMLPEWQKSSGAVMERAYAIANGYDIVYLTEDDIESYMNKNSKGDIMQDFNITLSLMNGVLTVDYNDGSNQETYPTDTMNKLRIAVNEVLTTTQTPEEPDESDGETEV